MLVTQELHAQGSPNRSQLLVLALGVEHTLCECRQATCERTVVINLVSVVGEGLQEVANFGARGNPILDFAQACRSGSHFFVGLQAVADAADLELVRVKVVKIARQDLPRYRSRD